MTAEYRGGHVVAFCGTCQARSTFVASDGRREFGSVEGPEPEKYVQVLSLDFKAHEEGTAPSGYSRTVASLLQCSTCRRPGLVLVACTNTVADGFMVEFLPAEGYPATVMPDGAPDDVVKNSERQSDAQVRAHGDAGSAVLRSALEKILDANGYGNGTLYSRIEAAAQDGVITAARKRRAHEKIRVLGNDILHDAWAPTSQADFETALHYLQLVVEDLYDDRETVEAILTEHGRTFTSMAPEPNSDPTED